MAILRLVSTGKMFDKPDKDGNRTILGKTGVDWLDILAIYRHGVDEECKRDKAWRDEDDVTAMTRTNEGINFFFMTDIQSDIESGRLVERKEGQPDPGI